MELVKRTEEYTIFKKRNGRFCVQTNNESKEWLNRRAKVMVLVKEGLVKAHVPEKDDVPVKAEVVAKAKKPVAKKKKDDGAEAPEKKAA